MDNLYFKIKRRKKNEDLNEVEIKENSNNSILIKEDSSEHLTPIKKFKNKPVLGVTTFSRQMWCEKSLEISLEKNIKVTSKAIEEGLKHHEELELKDHDVLNVIIENEYERISIDFLNIANLLNILIKRGYVRELPIIGFYNNIMIRGIVDSLKLKSKIMSNQMDYNANHIDKFRILIADTKTRRNTTLPSNVQQKTTVLQLGLYKKILNEMISCGKEWKKCHLSLNNIDLIKDYCSSLTFNSDLNNCCKGCAFLNNIFNFYSIDPFISFKKFREQNNNNNEDIDNKNFVENYYNNNENMDQNCSNDESQNKFKNQNGENINQNLDEDKDVEVLEILESFDNLIQIGYLMLLKFSKLPEIQPEMKVEYDYQGKTFATKWYKSSEEIIDNELEYLLGWWLGYRETENVKISESWKCRYCNVIEYCLVCPLSNEEKEKYIVQNKQNELDLLLLKDLDDSYFTQNNLE